MIVSLKRYLHVFCFIQCYQLESVFQLSFKVQLSSPKHKLAYFSRLYLPLSLLDSVAEAQLAQDTLDCRTHETGKALPALSTDSTE